MPIRPKLQHSEACRETALLAAAQGLAPPPCPHGTRYKLQKPAAACCPAVHSLGGLVLLPGCLLGLATCTPATGIAVHAEQSHLLVSVVLVALAFAFRVGQVGRRAAVYVGVQQLPAVHTHPHGTQALMRALDALHHRETCCTPVHCSCYTSSLLSPAAGCGDSVGAWGKGGSLRDLDRCCAADCKGCHLEQQAWQAQCCEAEGHPAKMQA